jgi:hypothetical protein
MEPLSLWRRRKQIPPKGLYFLYFYNYSLRIYNIQKTIQEENLTSYIPEIF